MQRAAGTSSAGPPWHLLLGSTHAQVHQGLENGQHTLLRLTLDLYENTTASRIASLRVQSAQLMLLSTTRSSSASWRSPAAQENKAPQLLSGLRALLFRAEPRAYWRSGCKLRLRDLFCLGRRAPTCVLGCHGGRARASDCKQRTHRHVWKGDATLATKARAVLLCANLPARLLVAGRGWAARITGCGSPLRRVAREAPVRVCMGWGRKLAAAE